MARTTVQSRTTRQQIDQKMEHVAGLLFSEIDRMVDEAGGTEGYVAKQRETTPISKLSKLFATSMNHLQGIGL